MGLNTVSFIKDTVGQILSRTGLPHLDWEVKQFGEGKRIIQGRVTEGGVGVNTFHLQRRVSFHNFLTTIPEISIIIDTFQNQRVHNARPEIIPFKLLSTFQPSFN